MKPAIRQQLDRHTERLKELDFLLSRPDIASDMGQFMKLSREHVDVAAVAERDARYQQREADLATAQALLADPDMRPLHHGPGHQQRRRQKLAHHRAVPLVQQPGPQGGAVQGAEHEQ